MPRLLELTVRLPHIGYILPAGYCQVYTVKQLEAAVAALCRCVCVFVFTRGLASMIALVDDNNIWISDKIFIRVVKHQMVG